MRARVFIDFWNFQLGWNDAASKAKCSWSTLPTVLVKEAGKLLAATGDTSGLVLDETIVHASVEDAKEANLRAWLTGWLAKQPSYAVKIRASLTQAEGSLPVLRCRHGLVHRVLSGAHDQP